MKEKIEELEKVEDSIHNKVINIFELMREVGYECEKFRNIIRQIKIDEISNDKKLIKEIADLNKELDRLTNQYGTLLEKNNESRKDTESV